MRVFLTVATGFIGSAIIPELIEAGHQVLGLARSDTGAEALKAAGAGVHRGDLEDAESLRSGARTSDAVIHCGFIHDFSRFKEVSEVDRRAIETLGEAIAGSDRPMIVTSGVGLLAQGRPATENDRQPVDTPVPRVSDLTGMALAEQGSNVRVVRLPQVHDTFKQGLVTYLIAVAREKGVSAYVGEGANRWSAVAVRDAAKLYCLALDKGKTGTAYHAVAEEGVPLREIAEAIGRGLKLPVVSLSPEQAGGHFGPLAMFAGLDMPASSALTQQWLGWHPTGPGLIEDLDNMRYET